uniref:LamG domain-containing protein n=1 Tax=Prosthecobacter sp. TaxID=1965333 RepID=UPI0037837571
GREAQYYKWTTTMEYTLFATPKAPPEQAFDTESATTERKGNSVVLDEKGVPLAVQPKGETQVGHSETLKAQAEAKKKGKGKNADAPKKGGAKGSAKSAPMPGSVQFPDMPVLDPTKTPITVEAWVLPDKPSGTIINHGGPRLGVGLDFHDKKPQFHIRSDSKVSSIVSAEALADGWHHIAGVLAADKKMTLYIDGKLVAEGMAGDLVAGKPANPLIVGNGSGVAEESAGAYSGLLDQLAVYHKALSAAEVQQRFEQPEVKPTDAVLVCNFDNGDSRDSSGNEVHGVGAGVESGKGKVGGALWFKGGADAKGGKGSGSFVKHTWDRFVPIVARSMALAGKTVLVSGAPDTIDEEYAFERLAAKDPAILQELKEQDEALDGKRGAKMWAVNTETGEQSAGLELTSPAVWDGITVAQGRVYVSTMDGRLQCFGK